MDGSVEYTPQKTSGINEDIYNKTLPNFGEKVFNQSANTQPEINDGNSKGSGSTNWTLIIVFIVLAVLLITIILLFIKRYLKRRSNKRQSTYDLEIGNSSSKNTKGERI